MPVITLNTFFGFVFGESAGPRLLSYGKGIFVLPARRAADEKATKDKKQAQFTFITENPTLSAEFRTMLRAQGNRDLENLLYDNTIDVLERSVNSGRYAIPSDDEIKEQFGKLEREYGYFGTDEKAFDNFVKLFKASKLIADYVEENNSTDNSVAYLHAYKMMVLFGANPFKSIETFVGTHAAKASKPIHDSLVLPIPKNSPPLKYLDQWQKLIIGSGSSVVSLFQQASEIEKILEAKEPFTFTLDSIKEAASQLAYKNYASNPELAKLCLQYHVEEENFNKCLEIKPKQSDNLPQVTVDGNTVGQRGYHLVKLPVDDPRAGILGKITNCCQSIGGHSEKCVIDGITRENNGFYVLLRAKSGRPKGATPPSPTRDDGRINYDNFEIVGQGYAWLSELNNLTLDSWENRTPSTDDAVIQAMLPEFAKQCFAQKPDIGRVTIGTGGKTPEVYKNAADKTAHPELMAEGYHYGDSSVQVAIALNPAVQEKAAAINAKLRDLDLDATVDICSIKQAEWFHELLEASTVSLYESTLGAGAYQKLLQKAATEPSVLDILFHLNQEEILIKKVTDLLLPLSGSESSGIARSVRCLTHAEPSLCTLDNFKRLVEPSVGVNDSQYIGVQLTRLSETGLLTDRNFNLVLSNREYAADVARILDKCEVRGGIFSSLSKNQSMLLKFAMVCLILKKLILICLLIKTSACLLKTHNILAVLSRD